MSPLYFLMRGNERAALRVLIIEHMRESESCSWCKHGAVELLQTGIEKRLTMQRGYCSVLRVTGAQVTIARSAILYDCGDAFGGAVEESR